MEERVKIAVIYRSLFGTTKKYAQWLADDLKADVYTFREGKNEVLQNYDTVIVASGTYASFMPLTAYLRSHWSVLKEKKVIVLSVGISPRNDPYTDQTFRKIPAEIRNSVKIVRLPGAMFGRTPPDIGEVKKENIKEIKKLL